MNGPEHYREAERLEAAAARQYMDSETGDPAPEWLCTLQRAQVHAGLAEVAAFVEQVGLAVEPLPANHTGPAEPGNEWGRALFGNPS